MTDSRKRILFIGEAVTLAHVARPATLAGALDPSIYHCTLACDPRYRQLFGSRDACDLTPIHSISTQQFTTALKRGNPVYDAATLGRYVEDDLRLLSELRPDLVVGDFRLSLSVSARLAKIPYWSITNAYWSPAAALRHPIPEHWLARYLGARIADGLFGLLRPIVYAVHAQPMNAVRKRYGLPSLGLDMRRAYTEADATLFADIPDLVPMGSLSEREHWLGPVLWEPDIALPDWWDSLPDDRPVVYLTLGSSGDPRLLRQIFASLSSLKIAVIAATVADVERSELPPNVFVAPFLPGAAACRRADLVLCNGGSPTTQQALSVGRPVIGIAGNLDQHLNMVCLEKAGAGVRLRSDTLNDRRLTGAVSAALASPDLRAAAARFASRIGDNLAVERFPRLLGALS